MDGFEGRNPSPRDATTSPSTAPGHTPSPQAQAPAQQPAPAIAQTKSRRIISCISCQQRKVKCDRQDPCAPCIKSRLTCQYRAPVTARRRRKKAPGVDTSLHERLAKLEDILRTVAPAAASNATGATGPPPSSASGGGAGSGSEPAQSPTTGMLSPPASETSTGVQRPDLADNIFSSLKEMGKAEKAPSSEFGMGRMFSGEGKSLFTENKLWATVSEEVQNMRELLDAYSSEDEEPFESFSPEQPFRAAPEEFLLNPRPVRVDLAALHPPPAQILQLWQLFLEGVNPFTKIVHVPTLQPTVLAATANPESLAKPDHALLFAIYACGAMTLTDEECMVMFNESVTSFQDRYHFAARQTFVRVGLFRTTDLRMLQAFTLFLFSVRPMLDGRTFWTLCGTATRIAQRMGVHRDGAAYKFPPFEAEMRRRLWWQMQLLDFSAAELCGSDLAPTIMNGDAKPPLSLDDADLHPQMTALPPERTDGPSEMMYPGIRNLFTLHFRENVAKFAKQDGMNWDVKPDDPRLGAIATHIQALRMHVRDLIEARFLRFARPEVAAERFCAERFRMSFLAFQLRDGTPAPIFFFSTVKGLARPQRDQVFAQLRSFLHQDNAIFRDPAFRRFRWLMRAYVQWHPFLGLLGEMRLRAAEEDQGPALVDAWRDVDEALRNHTEVLERRDPLYVAICGLALQAWEAMEREWPGGVGPGGTPLVVPASLAALRQRRQSRSAESGSFPPSEDSGGASQRSPESMGMGLQGSLGAGFNGTPDASEGLDFSLFDANLPNLGANSGGWDPLAELVRGYNFNGVAGTDLMALQPDFFDASMQGTQQ